MAKGRDDGPEWEGECVCEGWLGSCGAALLHDGVRGRRWE